MGEGRKLLKLEVNAGLCNRLRALVAGICWAEKLNRKLVIYWPSFKPECAAEFYDIFMYKCLPDFVEVTDYYLSSAESCLQRNDAERIFAEKALEDEINIKSHGNFWGVDASYLGYLRYLQPSLEVRDILLAWKEKGLETTSIAFHIRMTDNEKAIRLSPLELFAQELEESSETVVIFSDEPKAVEVLQQRFGSRILAFETLRTRRTRDGMIEAGAVFFALAAKTKIVGSANSSFSEIAHDFGGAELIVLRA